MEIKENKPFFEKWRKKLIIFVENQKKEFRIKNLENQVADLEKKLMSKAKARIKIYKSKKPIYISF